MAHPVAVSPAGGRRTWTLLGEDYATVSPVEEWLEAHGTCGHRTRCGGMQRRWRNGGASWNNAVRPMVGAKSASPPSPRFCPGSATAARLNTASPSRKSRRPPQHWKFASQL